MLVFIDESGAPGFKLAGGSSPHFIAAMVVFEDGGAAAKTLAAIEGSRARAAHRGEFKFSRTSNEVRTLFCEAVCGCNFSVQAIAVRKELIHSPRLMTNKDAFYNYFVKSMLFHNGGTLRQAKVIIDGSGDKAFCQQLESNFKRKIGTGIVRSVGFKDSKKDSLVQLADMCAGAIARSYREDRGDSHKWRAILAPRITDVWNFR